MPADEKVSYHLGDAEMNVEKNTAKSAVQDGINEEIDLDLEAYGEEHGYPTEVEALKGLTSRWANYQLAKDGRTVLIPQPSSDPNDVLNWSWQKKHAILFVITATSFLPDYGSACGAVTLIPQSQEWNLAQDHINHATVGNVFMTGAGGIVVVALASYFGRLPVLFWFTMIGVWTAAGCAASETFEAFMAFRILNGFFSTVAQGGGIMFIKDIFFIHERARKLNIWASFVVLSPYFGPLITAFITNTQTWQWTFGVFTIMSGLCWLAQMIWAEETYYNRKIPIDERPARQPGVQGKINRLTGIEQWRSRNQRSTFAQAVMRPVQALLKPTVFISTIYYLLTFAWVVGINTTLSIFLTPLYDFGLKQIGFFYFAPVTAAILGEFAGHWLHDIIAKVMTHRSKDKKLEPEFRLMAMAISTPFMVTGLVVLGFALEDPWHYMLAAFGWGFYVFGIMITTVAITSYNLDCYPEGSGEVGAWINMARTTGGFIISYFQVTWANAMGTKRMFAIQAAICVLAYLLVIFMQLYGKRLREKAGPLRFKTD